MCGCESKFTDSIWCDSQWTPSQESEDHKLVWGVGRVIAKTKQHVLFNGWKESNIVSKHLQRVN